MGKSNQLQVYEEAGPTLLCFVSGEVYHVSAPRNQRRVCKHAVLDHEAGCRSQRMVASASEAMLVA